MSSPRGFQLSDDGDDSGDVNPDILDDNSDSEEDQGSGSNRRPRNSNSASRRCRRCQQIREQWNDEVNNLNSEHGAQVRELKKRIKELEEEIERLKGRRITWDPWYERLVDLLGMSPDNNGANFLREYGKIYYNSFSQGNMSRIVVHPDLQIVDRAYSPREVERHYADQALHDRYGTFIGDVRSVHPSVRAIVFPLRCTRLMPLRYIENAHFPFENLPVDIQCRIWKLIIPNNQLIHCLSRLDPQYPHLDRNTRFPSRFHIGDGPCCIATADKPSRYLDYFIVSRRWYYVTAHLFYATNTFAFSSLGELGRFCDGIKKPRVERMVHIELMWHGALMPRQEVGVSLRKQPLAWFMHMSRLRTLVIHINESAKSRMRRRYEMLKPLDYFEDFGGDEYEGHDGEDKLTDNIFGMESRRTDLQRNYRKNRSMRTVQGIDFIYQLRGMKWVRLYDTNAECPRAAIQDSTFMCNLNSIVTAKKTDSMILKTQLENLRPFKGLREFHPDDETRELVASFYEDSPVDDGSVGGSETSSSSSSGFSGYSGASTASLDSLDSDSDDDFGDSSGSGRGGNNGDAIVIDSDTEMEDDENGSNGSSGANRDSRGSSHSGFGNRNRRLGGSGSSMAIPPRPPVIDIEDDDDNGDKRKKCRDGDNSGSDGLFVPSGSCSARSDYGPDGNDEDEVTVVSLPNTFVDLTLDDDDDMAMDIDNQNNDQEEGAEDDEIKSEYDDDEDGHHDGSKSMKGIKSTSQGSPKSSNSNNRSGPGMSLKRPRDEGDSD